MMIRVISIYILLLLYSFGGDLYIGVVGTVHNNCSRR